MDDRSIIELYCLRDENAVRETQLKYGRLCRALAMRLLGSREDACETENDTYLRAWNTIPPAEPRSLGAYLAAVCRRLSIDRLRKRGSKKRGGGVYEESLEELDGVFVSPDSDPADGIALRDALTRFLNALPPEPKRVFLLRYWWFLNVKEIARDCGMSESAVKSGLARTRNRLKDYLEKEGF